MRFAMRHEDLGFIDRAPMLQVVDAAVCSEQTAVFAALTDTAAWPRWFPGRIRRT
jgi:hypothetical protein